MAPRPGFIHEYTAIGSPPEHRDWTPEHGDKGVRIHPTAQVNAFCTIDAGYDHPTIVGRDVFMMCHCHIGHDSRIGPECELAPGTVVGGHVVMEPGVKCGIGVLIRPRVRIGAGAKLGAGAVVVHDVPAGETWVGNPAHCLHAAPLGEALTAGEVDGWEEIADYDPEDEGLREWGEWWDESRAQR